LQVGRNLNRLTIAQHDAGAADREVEVAAASRVSRVAGRDATARDEIEDGPAFRSTEAGPF